MISIGVSCAGFVLLFFLAEVLGDDTGDDTDGLGADIPYSVCGSFGTGSGVAGSDSGIVSFIGEAVAGLVSPAFEGFLFSGSLQSPLH